MFHFNQHAKFGIPHHYVKMSFSEAETRLFQRCNADIRKAFTVSKLLLDRQVAIPWNILQPESERLFQNSSLNILTKKCVTTYLLKQSLFNALEENAYKPGETDKTDNNASAYINRKALSEGNLPSVFQPNINHLHTFQPDDGFEHIRYILVQMLCHVFVIACLKMKFPCILTIMYLGIDDLLNSNVISTKEFGT